MKKLTSSEFSAWLDETDPKYLYNPETRMAYKDVGFYPQQPAYCKGPDGREVRITKKDEGLIKTLKHSCVMTAGEYAAYGPSLVFNAIPSSTTQVEPWLKNHAEKESIEDIPKPMADEFTTLMHAEMMDGEMTREELMCWGAYGAIERGTPKEEALKKYGVTEEAYNACIRKEYELAGTPFNNGSADDPFSFFRFYKEEHVNVCPFQLGTDEAMLWQAEKVIYGKWNSLTKGETPTPEQVKGWVADVVLRFNPYGGDKTMKCYKEHF